MTTARKDIDWATVRAAQKRSKHNRMLPGDFELCNAAWRADPDRYRAQQQEVHEEVFGEVALSGWPKDKEV